MTDPTLVPFPASENSGDKSADGRRLRGERSRRQIIDALFELVNSGDVNPGAARVAETAKVSLRTVFRHFEEMDSLYQEMIRQGEERFLRIYQKPFISEDWRGRLSELRDRRMRFFEDIMFLRICTESRRHQSEVLMANYKRFYRVERSSGEAVFPDDVQKNDVVMAAVDVALSFETYRRLRQERGLSPKKVREAVAGLLDMIVANIDA